MNEGIPTSYGGTMFRSRLEARWGAMFDLLGWTWEYEPMDCDGWIPDFAIVESSTVLVEVKPIAIFDPAVADKMDGAVERIPMPEFCGPASGTLPKYDLLLVGMRCPAAEYWPSAPSDDLKHPYLGWMEEGGNNGGMGWQEAAFGRWSGQSRIGFTHSQGVFVDRITGKYDGGNWGDGKVSSSEVRLMWREAGNRVQWRRKA